VPLSGNLCFTESHGRRCVSPGFPRWTSPNLFYYEDFTREGKPLAPWSAGTRRLVSLAGLSDCDDPITFAVTNFDPDLAVAQPNFADAPALTVPCGTSGGADCPPPNRVGTFERLAVSATQLRTVVVDVSGAEARATDDGGAAGAASGAAAEIAELREQLREAKVREEALKDAIKSLGSH
jgi:hypothetical protein